MSKHGNHFLVPVFDGESDSELYFDPFCDCDTLFDDGCHSHAIGGACGSLIDVTTVT